MRQKQLRELFCTKIVEICRVFMILAVSGRTDIVAFYMSRFMKRYEEGFLDVRNPFNPKLVNRIGFEDVDLIFFTTKNPKNLINNIKKIKHPIYVHVTLTGYGNDIETYVPNKDEIIEDIIKVSKIIGPDRIVVRYDPIFISDKYTAKYHVKMFNRLCERLDGYVNKYLISFLDEYKNVINNKNILKYKTMSEDDYRTIGEGFVEAVKKHNATVQTCFEERDLTEFGFIKGDCLSKELAYHLTGKTFKGTWKARKGNLCNCIPMVDVAAYNTCLHFCKYCYANYDEKEVRRNIHYHDENSSLLLGHLEDDDLIKYRKD